MRVTAPLALTLVSTSVAANQYGGVTLSAWNIATAYSVGNRVYYYAGATVPLVYHAFEALTAHIGQTPAIGGTSDWLDLGPVNDRAMFDSRTGTLTTASEEIDVTVAPGAFFDHIALVRLEGCFTVQITVSRGSGETYQEFYDQTFDVTDDATSWRDYFFSDDTAVRTALTITPQIFYSDTRVRVILTGATGSTVGLGLLLVGRGRDLGDTIDSPSLGIEDYSTKETDAFGNTYLLEREYADRASVQLILPPGQVDAVRRILASYRATPALYDFNNTDADERWDSLIIFGYYEDFEVTLSYPGKSFCSLSVQSLI
ncbi:MAG: hypothetical protein NHG36_10590 [Chromatiaceae bacterium]|nr:hypothetical protein [Candidatus Thioaporhodococcus sediminis]